MEIAGRKKPLEIRERFLMLPRTFLMQRGFPVLNVKRDRRGRRRHAWCHLLAFQEQNDELFEAMCERVRGPMTALVEKTADKDTEDPVEQLSAGHENLMQGVIDNPHYRKVLNILFHKCEYTDESDAIVIQQKEWQTYCNSMIQNTLVNAQLRKQLPDESRYRPGQSIDGGSLFQGF